MPVVLRNHRDVLSLHFIQPPYRFRVRLRAPEDAVVIIIIVVFVEVVNIFCVLRFRADLLRARCDRCRDITRSMHQQTGCVDGLGAFLRTVHTKPHALNLLNLQMPCRWDAVCGASCDQKTHAHTQTSGVSFLNT